MSGFDDPQPQCPPNNAEPTKYEGQIHIKIDALKSCLP
jgi:hypothetical protein